MTDPRWPIMAEEAAAAMRATGASRINVRVSWLRDQILTVREHADAWRLEPGQFVARVGCPAACIEVWTVADDAITSDWEPVL